MADEGIKIEVVLALAEWQYLRPLNVPCGTSVTQAVQLSGLADEFPQYVDAGLFGIFGKKVTAEHIVQAGERVEIYRPLLIDPKTARRTRAARNRQHDPD